ncbi:MAG: CdaR family protein [Fimbriimonadaceae bacterium]|nr:hypothetical protein [Chthonomonadaceae bacterium]MCO5296755.1 CdaR family protein [Fimbriimonadaceae bacterium]
MRDLARRLPILLVSFLLATGLWLYVRAQNALVVQQTFPIKLQAANLDPSLIVTRMSATINVEVEGKDQELRQIDEQVLSRASALVDFSNATAGPGTYRVTITPPPGSMLTWRPKDDGQVLVYLDRRIRRSFEVKVAKQGLAPDGLQVGDVLLDPSMVMLDGPESQINEVGEVRATLDVANVRPGETYESKVEIFGKDQGPLPLVTSEPSSVTLRPVVASAPPNRNVLIEPNWSGQLPFGIDFVSYSVTPNQVQVEGDREVLVDMQALRTAPIDLSAMSETKTLTVPLVVPNGAQVIDTRGAVVARPTVRVRVEVRPILPPATGSPPPSGRP